MSTPVTVPQRSSWTFLFFASLWLVPVLAGPGWSWIGFGVAALVVRDVRLWWPAAGYTLLGIVAIGVEEEWSSGIAAIVRTIAWVAAIVHALTLHPRVLRAAAGPEGAADGAGASAAARSDRARRSRPAPSGRSRRGGRSRARPSAAGTGAGEAAVPEEARPLAEAASAARSALLAPEPDEEPAAPTVDVNTASRRALSRLPGMDRASAAKAVAARDARGGFDSLDEFARAAGLQPHQAVRLRAAAFCSPRPRPRRTFARRVDL